MCEFCFGPTGRSTSSDRDATHVEFAGFFSAEAIEAAVRQATTSSNDRSQQQRRGGQQPQPKDDDSDGT